MKKVFLLWLLALLPLLVAAQSVPVPTTIPFAGLSLHLTDGAQRLVQKKVDALRSHPSSFQARVVLADAYFPLIERVFQQEGVPLDFRFLALQESGLQGEAQSIHDAVGYWQFKREAAADFGLLMNDQVDERKHIISSSRAAALYLKRSNNAFHNWLDVLLSYNLGIGGAKPYYQSSDAGATGMEVDERTHPYIITFLAHKIAYESSIGLNPSPTLALQEFPAQPGQPLMAMAQAYHTTPDELTRYNHWLLASTIPTDKAYTLLVPITDAAQLQAIAAQRPAMPIATATPPPYEPDPRHPEFVLVNGLRALVAQPGDTKESLADRARLKLRRFMQYNDLFAFDNIVAGRPYFVQKKRDKAAVEYHVVRSDESVITVAQQYGIRARSIRQKNRMGRSEELRAGRVLWLQHTRPRDVAVEYANNDNAPVVAAFERPVGGGSVPAPATRTFPTPPATAPTPAVAATMPAPPDTATSDTLLASDTLATAPPTPAPASVYTAPAPQPMPASAPLADEPQPDSAATTIAADEIIPAPGVVLRDPTAPRTTASTPSTTPIPPRSATPPVRPATAPTPAQPTVAQPATAPVVKTPTPVTVPTAAVPVAVPANGLHTVRPKETLYGIARLYNLSPRDLEAWNNLPLNPSLQLGQVLRVVPPVAGSPAPASPARTTTPTPAPSTPAPTPAPAAPATTAPIKHTVQAGESMYGISRKYGVTIKQILEWNSKDDFNVKPGEVLLIQQAAK